MTVTFDDDPELRDAIAGVIEKRMKEGRTKRGDALITLMGVAREIIRAGHLASDARYMVLRACIDRLCLGRRGPTQMIPQTPSTHVQGFSDLVRDMELKSKVN